MDTSFSFRDIDRSMPLETSLPIGGAAGIRQKDVIGRSGTT